MSNTNGEGQQPFTTDDFDDFLTAMSDIRAKKMNSKTEKVTANLVTGLEFVVNNIGSQAQQPQQATPTGVVDI